MATGDAMYQSILDYHFIAVNLMTVLLVIIIHVLQVSLHYFLVFLFFTYVCVMHLFIGASFEAKNSSASARIHQRNNLVDDVTLHSFINNGALEDKADKCSINEQQCRRRLVTMKGSTL